MLGPDGVQLIDNIRNVVELTDTTERFLKFCDLMDTFPKSRSVYSPAYQGGLCHYCKTKKKLVHDAIQILPPKQPMPPQIIAMQHDLKQKCYVWWFCFFRSSSISFGLSEGRNHENKLQVEILFVIKLSVAVRFT